MPAQFDIFISFKDKDPATGRPTRDSQLARECHDFLSGKGFNVFCSTLTLEALGASAYREAIDAALDQARVLIAVGTSAKHLNSRWPKYEWGSFGQDILDGIKPAGQIIAYLEGMDLPSLPRPLRQWQAIAHGPGSLDQLFRFIANGLGTEAPGAVGETTDKTPPGPTTHDDDPDHDTDELTRQAVKLLGSGDHRAAVSRLTQAVTRCQTMKDVPGQATALIELARIASSLPERVEFALKLARKAQLLGSNNGLKELTRESAAIVASIRRRLGSVRPTTLATWISEIIDDELAVVSDSPGRSASLAAIEGSWEWVMLGNVSVPVDCYARIIGGRLWVPYSYGSTGVCTSIYYGFRRVNDAWFARFSWKDPEISGFSFWNIESPDVINGEWWYDNQADELPVVRRPTWRGHATRMERVPGKVFPTWAEEVFAEIERRCVE